MCVRVWIIYIHVCVCVCRHTHTHTQISAWAEAEDERVLGQAHDIFGRERFADDREDMGGIGYVYM